MNEYRRRKLMLAIVAIGVPCAVFIVGIAWIAADYAAVSECDGPAPNTTLSEIRDTQDAERLIGKTRAEVVAEFGEPTSSRFASEWDISYGLRPQGFCLDTWYLVLNTTSDGLITDAAILGD